MILKRLRLLDFRNIEWADLSFSDGVNLLYGQNAQGKTNLVEAVQYCGCGKSFRNAKDSEVVRFGQECAAICADFGDGNQTETMTLQMFPAAKKKRIFFQKQEYEKMAELLGKFRTVLFTPEHLRLIQDGPAERRKFLDIALCTLYPVYLHNLSMLQTILKERNALLKDADEESAGNEAFRMQIGAWNEGLAKVSAVIARYRAEYIDRLQKAVQTCFADMTSGREVPVLRYECGFCDNPLDEEKTVRTFSSRMEERLTREIYAKCTLWGPHKDDVEILLNEKSARSYASQGQQRSLALACKLGEGQICADVCGTEPVYLLDDVMSELDEERRSYLLRKVDGKQVIITCCDEAVAVGCETSVRRIRVEDGCFEE